MKNMTQNFNKLTEKEKEEFLSKMNEEERTLFFKNKERVEEREKVLEQKLKKFEQMSE